MLNYLYWYQCKKCLTWAVSQFERHTYGRGLSCVLHCGWMHFEWKQPVENDEEMRTLAELLQHAKGGVIYNPRAALDLYQQTMPNDGDGRR